MTPVETFAQVQELANRYGQELNASPWMQRQLAKNRRWYLVPTPAGDVVANSSFIGFKGMDAKHYEGLSNRDMNLLRPIPVLDQWFCELAPGPELNAVREQVQHIVTKYGRSINQRASFYAPKGWRPTTVVRASLHLGNVHLRGTIPAAIYRGEQRYVAECPLLGIVTQGTTLEETLANLREAFEVTIEGEDPVQLGIAAGAVLLVQVEAARWDA